MKRRKRRSSQREEETKEAKEEQTQILLGQSVLEYDEKDDDEDEEDEESEDDGKTFADISDWTEKASNKSSEKIGLEKNCPSIRQEADNA